MNQTPSAHLSTGELLALRDAEPDSSLEVETTSGRAAPISEDASSLADRADHLRKCSTCRRELEGLHQIRARLRALPTQSPSRDGWPTIRERWLRERRWRRWRRSTATVVTLAATLLLGLGLRAWRPDAVSMPEEAGHAANHSSERSAGNAPAVLIELAASVAALREESQMLEAELRALPERAVWSGWRAETIVRLEDRIAVLDERLGLTSAQGGDAAADADLELWRERVELQGVLFQLHVAPVYYRGV